MLPATQGSFRLFRLFGINVYLHWSWFLIILLMYSRATAPQNRLFVNPLWWAALYLSLFAIVLMHEFGHALACRSVGGKAERIILWPLGGVAFVQPPSRPGALLWSIVAGPLVNVILIPILFGLWFGVEKTLGPDHYADLQTLLQWLSWTNVALFCFNMLPVYPLDGGQTLQALLWFIIGRIRSLQVAAWIGVIVAILAGGTAAFFFRDAWLVVMAFFIGWQAYNGLRFARMLTAAEQAGYRIEEPWRR